jgi:citrate synthase
MTKTKAAWLDADEAVEALGVSRATLYAYVSRGRIRSEAAPGAQRRSRYSRDDIERLKARSSERRNPEKAAEHALHWGLPILESAITLIADERIYYRGHELGALARERSVAEVAALLWTGTTDARALDARACRSSPRRSPRSLSPPPMTRSPTTCGHAPWPRPAGGSSGC